jgi:hypothetical protein
MEIAALHERKWPELKLLHAIPNGGYRHVATAVALKKEGVKRGVPDLDLPVARGGYHGLRIEMKVGKNRPTKEQRWWLKELTRHGYLCCVCYSAAEAWRCISEYLQTEDE